MRAKPQQAVVLDTNIWISAALSPQGSPAKAIRLVLQTGIPVLSHATYSELESRLCKPKFDRAVSMELRRQMLRDVQAAALWVVPSEALCSVRYSRDPDDDCFIHAALSAGASWLVTGDDDLLSVPPIQGLSIVTAQDFLRLTIEGM